LEATGSLQNPKEVLSREEYKRFRTSEKSFDKPLIIVNPKRKPQQKNLLFQKEKYMEIYAKMLEILVLQPQENLFGNDKLYKLDHKKSWQFHFIPKKGIHSGKNILQKQLSNLEDLFKIHFDYPYPKAVSVHAKNQGMEYPMICWNYGRPDEDGNYSDRTKFGMISVIIHEVGHNYFPMIVNSDERQWGWMDEGS